MPSNPKISIITVVYNGERLIERTIKSILVQEYANIEYIIIDGASSDGTMMVVDKYRDNIQTIVSEKDKGIYDAMNKGLAQSTGDYVLFMNAGDELFAKTTLKDIFAIDSDVDVYYGNTMVADENQNLLADRRLTPPEKLNWKSFKLGMSVSHQSFIAKRSICEAYNMNYRLAADIDWIINILKKSKKVVNTNLYISKFLVGGITSDQRTLAWKERFKVLAVHYGFILTVINHVYIVFRFLIHKITHKSMT